MMNVTTHQARQRFKVLPPVLQEAIFSEQTAEIVSRIGEQNHIPVNKISGIAEAAGLVLLGFIHPEEVGREVSERTGIAPAVAKAVSDSLDNRLFRPLRDEIDRVYAPAGPEPIRIVTEIQAPRVEDGLPTLSPEPRGMAPWAAPPAPPPPLGPSRTSMKEPFPREAASPAPVILHKETEAEPGKKLPDFALGVSPQKSGLQPSLAPPPVKPAHLVMGPSRAESSRVVHYTEFRTPLDKEKDVLLPSPPAPQTPRPEFMTLKPETPLSPAAPSLPLAPKPPPLTSVMPYGAARPTPPPPPSPTSALPQEVKEELIDTTKLEKIPKPPVG